METYLGIVILVSLVTGMFAVSRLKMRRFRKLWETGISAFDDGDLETAETAFKKCIKIAPLLVVVRRMQAKTLTRLDRMDEAEELLSFASQLEPRNAECHLDLACFLVHRGPHRYDEALASLGTTLEHGQGLVDIVRTLPALEPLRDHAEFQRLLQSAATRADARTDTPP